MSFEIIEEPKHKDCDVQFFSVIGGNGKDWNISYRRNAKSLGFSFPKSKKQAIALAELMKKDGFEPKIRIFWGFYAF